LSRTIVECVPNFSEGRDVSIVDAIVAAIRTVPGVAVLDREMDADHNRSVVTFAAAAEIVGEAAIRGVEKAVALIDLNRHSGVHPRIGAADVVPFVPVEGVTLADCVQIAERVGAELWRRLRLPVYLYEAAARGPDRVNLENIRKGGFENLREEVRVNPVRRPDFGEAELHPTAGATVVGARKFLIAYNINLQTDDVAIAKRIARTIRSSSGGLPCVKAMGVPLASRNLAQVSMNLTDFEQTPMHRVFEAVRTEAARDGVAIAGSEIIGLVPSEAIAMSAGWYLQVENFRLDMILENRMARTQAAGSGLDQFLDALADPSAAAGALAAALGSRVALQAKLDPADFDAARHFFSVAAERKDTAARVAEEAGRLKERLRTLAETAPAEFRADIDTAAALVQTCIAAVTSHKID
jgi:glutamate formiminotransferase